MYAYVNQMTIQNYYQWRIQDPVAFLALPGFATDYHGRADLMIVPEGGRGNFAIRRHNPIEFEPD